MFHCGTKATITNNDLHSIATALQIFHFEREHWRVNIGDYQTSEHNSVIMALLEVRFFAGLDDPDRIRSNPQAWIRLDWSWVEIFRSRSDPGGAP